MHALGLVGRRRAAPCFVRARRLCLAVAVAVLPGAALAADTAVRAEEAAVQKTLKTLVNAIRYHKDPLALRQLALETMGQNLLADSWQQMAPQQRQTFTDGLRSLLQCMSFSRGREIFQYLDAVLYAPVSFEGGRARCKTTVVIHRDLKKKEIPIEWVLIKDGGSWKVMDTVMMGESTIQSVRDEQVAPLLKEGGVPRVMEALAAQVHKCPQQAP